MNEEELQKDILFQIDMQLYDKYNKKIAGMNDHLGDIYTYRDIEEVEQAQKDEKIDLLTKAIKELQEEIERLKKFEKYYENEKVVWQRKDYVSKDKIREKIDLIDKEYAEIIEKNKNDLYLVNINAQRHSAMQSILEELLGE